mgnify:FL=1
MRILLKFDLDCSADAAWEMLTDPRALQQLYSPVMSVTPLEPGGFPAKLGEGRHEIAVRAFGLLPMGTQFITITFPKRKGGVRMLRDSGPTMSGLLGLITTWEHSMAVSSLPDGRTRYRDQLRFSAGILTPVIWPILWGVWQWRAWRIQRLAESR